MTKIFLKLENNNNNNNKMAAIFQFFLLPVIVWHLRRLSLHPKKKNTRNVNHIKVQMAMKNINQDLGLF